MAEKLSPTAGLRCFECGYEAPVGEEWTEVNHPPIGTLTQCRQCGSTNVQNLVE